MKPAGRFLVKVTLIHVVTYTLCGLLFMTLFQYSGSLEAAGMRETSDPIVRLAPVFQIVRGLLFGLALWLVKDSFLGRKYGWLILWLVLVILGIVNTPGTGDGSIEKLIYYETSAAQWNLQLGGMLEILAQTLLFSVLVFLFCRDSKRSGR